MDSCKKFEKSKCVTMTHLRSYSFDFLCGEKD